jgi:RNA polymerase sigma-70 factor (ECF subfamily)
MDEPAREVDAEVIQRAAAGDEAALRRIFDTYSDRVFRLAYRMTMDTQLAEDLTQDTFMRAFSRLHQFRGASRFGTWLHGVAASVTLNGLRSRRARWRREVPLESVGDQSRTAAAPEPDVKDRLRNALQALPADQRVVLLMYDVEGYSHDEIADALGIGAGASRMRLARAREQMRRALELHRGEWNDG